MAPSDTTPQTLAITLFGPMKVLVHGQPLTLFRSRKSLWLLALLILRHDRPVVREWLAGTLWPDVDQSQGFANLRVVLSELRKAFGSEGARLQTPNRQTLFLDLTGAQVDMIAFDAAIASGKAPALKQAAALYGGPLLEGCMEEWVFQERDVRERHCLQALQTLADSALAAGDYETAIGYYQRAVNIAPLWDAAQRGWMEALAKSGDRNAALRVYREFTELLRKDDPTALPDEQTNALYTRLRAEIRPKASTLPVVPAAEANVAVVTGYLPHALTDLVGREDEQIEVATRLRRSRLVTLTGLGGIGKTRLAMEVASESVAEYAEGVWLVALESLTEGRLVAQQIASTLRIREEPGCPLLQSITDHLHNKRALLVLDNCEHLLEAGAQVAAHLLRECRKVRILATSREPLGIIGETVWTVPPLAVPDIERLPQKQTGLPDMLMEYESVRLFIERARAVQKSFAFTEDNALAVAEVCVQLEGIPLAIELAATRVKAMTVEQIALRLNNELDLLTGGNRAALSRQQTLRATLDWSHALLTEPEQRLLRRLSVFVGGWTLEAAEALCEKEGTEGTPPLFPQDALDLLTSLVDKSLVVFEERDADSGGRYRLLEMVRQYAAERLVATEEEAQMQARHANWCLRLAEEMERQLQGARQAKAMQLLETEYDNMRAALAWCGTPEAGAETGLQLTGALWRLWEMRGHYREGRAYLADALNRAGSGGRTQWRARALIGAGVLAYYQGDHEAAKTLHEESLAISRELGDKRGIAWPLHHLGQMALRQGDYQTARTLHEESLAISRELEDRQGIAWTLHQLASVAREHGEYETARALSTECLAIWQELGNKQGIAWSLNDLGNVRGLQGEYADAATLYEESLAISRELGDRQGIAWSLHHQGNVIRPLGDYAKAETLYAESLEIFRAMGEKQGTAWTLRSLGDVVSEQGDYARAATLQQESLALQRELGNKLGIARALSSLGKAAYNQDDLASARFLYRESLNIQKELEDRRGILESLERLAAISFQQTEIRQAVRLWGAAQALRTMIGLPQPRQDQAQYRQQVEQARSELGEADFTMTWEEGSALPWERSVSYALNP